MKVTRRKPRTANVGIFGVGFHKYWAQFDGLLDELKNKLDVFVARVKTHQVKATNFGIVDDAASAYALLPKLKAADLDLLFCDMLTYATSATFAAIIRGLDIPVVLVALQPLRALDYARTSTYVQLANDDFCSVPEFTGVAIRMGKRPPPVVLGTLGDDPAADREIAQWCDIAKTLHDLKRARIGHFGHPIEHMLDMQTDQTALTAAFGCHVVQTEADQLLELERSVTEKEVQAKRGEILGLFDTPDPKSDPLTQKLTEKDLQTAARVAVALDKFVTRHNLDGLAYYYEGRQGSPTRELLSNLIVGNSLLTAAGVPICGESDLKTCVAMMIMDRLDIGGSFAEFHPIDFKQGFVLVGHDGPHHINIADGKPVLRSLTKFHGKPGCGASVEFKIKEGPITMLSIGVTHGGRFKFVLAEGQSVHGPIPATGNTNTRGFFGPDIRTFLKRWVAEGPTHHFALGVGHRGGDIQQIAEILGLENVLVTCVRIACLLAVVGMASIAPARGMAADRSGPNIVFFLVDDLGWTDVGCYGSPLHQTPHVDRLAGEGVRFTNAYAPGCSCSPSRAGIMTGKYPARLGMTAIIEKHRGNHAPHDAPLLPATTKPFLPHEEVTIAEALKAKGYATCLVGKWHLGENQYGPRGSGFDVAIAPPHRGMPKSYFWPRWDGNPDMPGRFDGEYLTDRLADEGCRFIETHQEKPFFLYLSFYSVHVPIEAKQEKVAKYESLLEQKGGDALQHHNPHYASMVESVDDAVGKVLYTLDRLNLDGNTMVLFFSDNGGLAHPSHVGEHTPATSNKPLRSGKGFLYEGGIREPLIIKWPNVARPNSKCSVPVHGCDLFPTICEAAQVESKDLPDAESIDGKSLRPLLADPLGASLDRPLFWHYPHFSSMGGRPSGAVRSGQWKLIEHFEANRIELFDLAEDIGETKDVSRAFPEKARQLSQTLVAWRKSLHVLMPDRPNPNYIKAKPQGRALH